MFCQKCGTQIADDSAFCPACGTPVQSAAPVQPAAPVVEQPVAPAVEQSVAPAVEQPAAAPVAPATFNPNAMLGKVKIGTCLNLAMAFTFFVQLILYFCNSISVKISNSGFTVFDKGFSLLKSSTVLSVFGILFSLVALVCSVYLVAEELLNFSIPEINAYKKFSFAPAAAAAFFNLIAWITSFGGAKTAAVRKLAANFGEKHPSKSEIKEVLEYTHAKVTFGGVLFLLFTIAALALIGYKCYLIFVKKEEA